MYLCCLCAHIYTQQLFCTFIRSSPWNADAHIQDKSSHINSQDSAPQNCPQSNLIYIITQLKLFSQVILSYVNLPQKQTTTNAYPSRLSPPSLKHDVSIMHLTLFPKSCVLFPITRQRTLSKSLIFHICIYFYMSILLCSQEVSSDHFFPSNIFSTRIFRRCNTICVGKSYGNHLWHFHIVVLFELLYGILFCEWSRICLKK